MLSKFSKDEENKFAVNYAISVKIKFNKLYIDDKGNMKWNKVVCK